MTTIIQQINNNRITWNNTTTPTTKTTHNTQFRSTVQTSHTQNDNDKHKCCVHKQTRR